MRRRARPATMATTASRARGARGLVGLFPEPPPVRGSPLRRLVPAGAESLERATLGTFAELCTWKVPPPPGPGIVVGTGTGVAGAVGGPGVAVGVGGGGGGVVTAAKVCKTGERIVPPTVSRPIVRGSARATMRRLFMQDSLR